MGGNYFASISNYFSSIFYKQRAISHDKAVTPRYLWNKVGEDGWVAWSSQHQDSPGCLSSYLVGCDSSLCNSKSFRQSTGMPHLFLLVFSFLQSKISGVSCWVWKQWICSQRKNESRLDLPERFSKYTMQPRSLFHNEYFTPRIRHLCCASFQVERYWRNR